MEGEREGSVAMVLAVNVGARPGAKEHSGLQARGQAGSRLPPAQPAEEARLPTPGFEGL